MIVVATLGIRVCKEPRLAFLEATMEFILVGGAHSGGRQCGRRCFIKVESR